MGGGEVTTKERRKQAHIRRRVEERTVAAICGWLRTRAPHDGVNTYTTIADAIERGSWK